MPYRSKKKQRAATRKSTSKWYQAHKEERAAYMRKYRRARKRAMKRARSARTHRVEA